MDQFLDERLSPEAFIRLPELLKQVGLSRSVIYALAKAGRFPAPHKLTSRASGWLVGEVREWKADPLRWRSLQLQPATSPGNPDHDCE